MIVRIATEGQYEISDTDVGELNELDNEAVSACAQADEQRFEATFERLLSFVREHGRPVPSDELAPSHLILPPPDASMDEVREEFSGEGLIPG